MSEFNLLKIRNPGLENYLMTVERIEIFFEDIFEDYQLILRPMDEEDPTIEYCNETISLKFLDQRYDGYEMEIEVKGYDKTSLGELLGFYFDGYNYRKNLIPPNTLTLEQKVNFQLTAWRYHILRYWKIFLDNDTKEIQKFIAWQELNNEQIRKHLSHRRKQL
ncbi:hypothetical protein [Roseivirga sp. 4D4]|uniref:hypothetical protein n=1 Tax=Roseivirga sp. 4D4 TaxID=1889784 RepID=UPI001112D57C|nr:hypothetical protein [Roseivirga sp. 4D4]